MLKKVINLFLYFEKEEKWLNKMAAQGWALTNCTFFVYTFEKSEPGEWIYHIEYLERDLSSTQTQEYLSFMNEKGVETVSHFASQTYFRKKVATGSFELFFNTASRIANYKHIIRLWVALGLGSLAIGVVNLTLTERQGARLWLPLMSIALGVFFVGACIPYLRKVRALERERQVHE